MSIALSRLRILVVMSDPLEVVVQVVRQVPEALRHEQLTNPENEKMSKVQNKFCRKKTKLLLLENTL